jgi:GH24 family phage-related lysozyme (muramidase)
MQVSPAGLSLVQAWEGIEDGNPSTVLLDPYIDPKGFYTVGWGNLLTTAAGVPICIHTQGAANAATLARDSMLRQFGAIAISRDQAVALLNQDMGKTETFVTQHVVQTTTQSQFDALCAFTFNVGMGNLQSSSVLRLHNAGQRSIGLMSLPDLATWSKGVLHSSPQDMPEAFAAWAYSGGSWMLGLFRRRISEALVYGGVDGAKAYATMQQFNV